MARSGDDCACPTLERNLGDGSFLRSCFRGGLADRVGTDSTPRSIGSKRADLNTLVFKNWSCGAGAVGEIPIRAAGRLFDCATVNAHAR